MKTGHASRDMRLLAVFLMCAATVCFSGIDSSAKWLGMRLPEAEVVWARYVGAAIFSVMVARPWRRPQTFHAKRPWLQLFRSALLLGSTYANFLALRKLQLAETSTISFLSPLFVAVLGASGALGHWLMLLAHQRAPASAMAPFGYTQLLWMIVIGSTGFTASLDAALSPAFG